MTIMVRFYGVVFSLKWLYSNILLCSLWWRMIWKYQCLKEGIEVECVISYVINLHNKWKWSNLVVQFNWTKWSLKISTSCVSKKVFWQTSPCAWNFDAAYNPQAEGMILCLMFGHDWDFIARQNYPKRWLSKACCFYSRDLLENIFKHVKDILFFVLQFSFLLKPEMARGPEERVALNPVYCWQYTVQNVKLPKKVCLRTGFCVP